MSADPFDAAFGVGTSNPKAVALDRHNTGGIIDSPFARSQPGYAGANGRYAAFETPEHGLAAHRKLVESYVSRGIDTPAAIAARWAPAGDGKNNPTAYAATIATQMGIKPTDKITPTQIDAFVQAQARAENSGYQARPQLDPNNPFDVAFGGGKTGINGNLGSNPFGATAGPVRPVRVAGDGAAAARAAGTTPSPVGGANNRPGGVAAGGAVPRGGSASNAPGALTRGLRGIEDFSDTLWQLGASGLDAANRLVTASVSGRPLLSEPDSGWLPGGFTARQLVDAGIAANERKYQAGRRAAVASTLTSLVTGQKPEPGFDFARMGGNILATAPVSSVQLLSKIPAVVRAGETVATAAKVGAKAPALARALTTGARVGDAAIQGGTGAALLSSANNDPLQSTGIGAGIGAGVGLVSPLAGKAYAAVAPKLLSALESVGIRTAAPNVRAPAQITPQDLANGLTTGSNTRGLIANTNLPAPVLAHVQELVRQGVPIEQAVREAEAAAIGARPTVPQVTRDFHDQYAVNEAAKLDTPAGRDLTARATENNAAAHNSVGQLVEGYGGLEGASGAAHEATTALANAADASRANVADLYKTADLVAGTPATADVGRLSTVLDDLSFRAPKTPEGRAFVSGLKRDLAQFTRDGRQLTASELEGLRQRINAAFDPSASGEVNTLVAKAKAAVDDAFDTLGNNVGADRAGRALGVGTDVEQRIAQELQAARAGVAMGIKGYTPADVERLTALLERVKTAPINPADAYKAARAAHAEHMGKFDQPGVGDLVRRKANGEFVNDAGKMVGSILSNKDPRAFANIIERLKDAGRTDVIDKLKASVIQNAYEAVTKAGAGDATGNVVLNGKRFLAELDKLGSKKLEALFTPEELGQIASIGRGAMHVNVPVAGAANNSNTSSALLNALMAAQAKAKAAANGGKLNMADLAVHIGTNATGIASGHEIAALMLSGAAGAAKLVAAKRGGATAATALEEAATQAGSPATARAAAAARQKALAAQLRGTRGAAALAAPAGAIVGGRK
jgi:hypothetical protein